MRKEILLNSSIMCDMLLLKCESMDMFMYPTLETLTEISEDGVSSGVKTPRGVLVLNEDNNSNTSRMFETFSTPIDSPSVISFQMDGERQMPSRRSSGKSRTETLRGNEENSGPLLHDTPNETKPLNIMDQTESTKSLNMQENEQLHQEHKQNTECEEQKQTDLLLKSETSQENSLQEDDGETIIVKQILRSPSDCLLYTSRCV